MILRLLGPVEVTGPHGSPALTRRQRALVGLLGLQAGAVVTQGQVAAALWGDEPPRTAVKSLHSHVARVRQALAACGLTGVLLTQGSGYSLAIDRADIDVCNFEDGVRTARSQLAQSSWAAATEQLRASLALWTGEPVLGGELAGWGRAEVTRLQELRLAAIEDLCDAELRLGHHAAVAGELERLLVRHPLRERVVELLMLALYRAGRPVDALQAYHRLRHHLAHELGVDPSPGLQRLHAAVLRHELAPRPAEGAAVVPARPPAQLPPRVGYFTGRARELHELDRLLDARAEAHIAVICGPGGMGKTALAIQWAHRVRHQFPDGQLFLDLRGHGAETGMTAAEALVQLLRDVGVPDQQMPAELPALVGLYRSTLDSRRLLIVLDNAATADQVQPLVPPTATSALVVTSRRPLTALATFHAVQSTHLGPMDDTEALALLSKVVGEDRLDRETDQGRYIVTRCGRMPLALRIVAAKLASQPGLLLRDVAEDLAGADPLDALSVEGGSPSVRKVFADTYQWLPEPAARMFHLLTLHPGPTFGPHLAAAVADTSLSVAKQALADLADAYLITPAEAGRFRFHDLIQLYAAERARQAEDGMRLAEAADRLVDWYLCIAEAANRVLDTGRDPVVPVLLHPPPAVPFAARHQDALSFLDAERDSLLPVVRFAAERGRDEAVWQLTYLLTSFVVSQGRWADRVEVCQLGLLAARRLADPAAEGLMRSGLGVAYIMTRRYHQALDSLHPALELTRRSGDRHREGLVRNNIATAYARLRRFDEALEAYQDALAVHRANDDRLGVALALNNIGTAHIRLGRPEHSLTHLDQALQLSREIKNPRIEAAVVCSLGEACLRQGRLDDALRHFQQALAIRRSIGDHQREVDTLHDVGQTYLARAEPDRAAEHFRDALRGGEGLADRHLVSVSLTHLGVAHIHLGDLDAAGGYLGRALALRESVPDAYQEATIYRALGELAERCGQPVAAAEHRRRAATLYQQANAAAEAADLVRDTT